MGKFAALWLIETYTPVGRVFVWRTHSTTKLHPKFSLLPQSNTSFYKFETMPNSPTQINEQSQPSQDQLVKIVDSLCLLIDMQSDRDERQENTFDEIQSKLDSLEEKIEQLSAGGEQASNEDDGFAQSIFAKYGLTNDDENSDPKEEVDPDSASSVEDSLDVESARKEEPDDEVVVEQPAREIPPMDLEEINAIKEQLREKLREAEVELSVRRANLSQREAVLEEKEARLKREIQRKMILSKDTDGTNSNTMLGRLKIHLREFTAAKMAKSSQDRDSNGASELDGQAQDDINIEPRVSDEPGLDDKQD